VRLVAEIRQLRNELDVERGRQAIAEAHTLAASAVDGVVVERRDGFTNDTLRKLAIATRDALGTGVVGVVGLTPEGDKAVVAVAVSKDLVAQGVNAGSIAKAAAAAVGGGVGKQADVAVGGGPKAEAIEDALAALRAAASAASSPTAPTH
jgi:alanyl-tRNA synthetase